MKGKITLLVGGAIGYVLGSRAGRERYEQIKSQAEGFWQSPKVQEKKQEAQDFAKEKAPVVKAAAADAASAAKDKVGGESTDDSPSGHSTTSYPTSASTGSN